MTMKPRPLSSGILTFLVTTLGEFFALYYWFRFFSSGHVVVAIISLWVGFTIERGAIVAWLRLPRQIVDNRGNTRSLLRMLLIVTLGEILTWLLWIHLSSHISYLLGAAVFALLIHLIHSYESSVIQKGAMGSSMTSLGPIALSVVETLGAVGWLYYTQRHEAALGAAILLGSLFVEHTLQVVGLSQALKSATR